MSGGKHQIDSEPITTQKRQRAKFLSRLLENQEVDGPGLVQKVKKRYFLNYPSMEQEMSGKTNESLHERMRANMRAKIVNFGLGSAVILENASNENRTSREENAGKSKGSRQISRERDGEKLRLRNEGLEKRRSASGERGEHRGKAAERGSGSSAEGEGNKRNSMSFNANKLRNNSSLVYSKSQHSSKEFGLEI